MAAPILRWGCRKSSRIFLASVNKTHNNALSLSAIRPQQCLEAVRTIRTGAREKSAFIISKRGLTLNVQPSRRFSSDSEGESSRKRSLKLMDFPLIYDFPWNTPLTVVRNWAFTLLIRGYFDQEFNWTNFQQGAKEVARSSCLFGSCKIHRMFFFHNY